MKAAALELGLPVSHAVDDVLGGVSAVPNSASWSRSGSIIKPHVLDVMPMVNLHFSLLPRWRGAAPVERALLAGDDVTGVCVMAVEEGLDTGGVYARREVPIGAGDHGGRAAKRSSSRSARRSSSTPCSRRSSSWIDQPEPQVGESTYAAKFSGRRLRDRLVEAGRRDPPARARRRRLDDVPGQTSQGQRGPARSTASLVPTIVQPEGKAAMSFESWRNGARPSPDELFGSL